MRLQFFALGIGAGFGGALALLLLLSATSPASPSSYPQPAPQDGVQAAAPYVTGGAKIWGLRLAGTQTTAVESLSDQQFVEIIGAEGSWALVKHQGQTRGPVWINFDQALTYRTAP